MRPPALSAFELDALREIANIGSGHAATVLSKMTGRAIMIDVPNVEIDTVDGVMGAVARHDEPVVTLTMHMLGDLTGTTFFVLKEANAGVLCDLLLARPVGSGGVREEMEQSCLQEMGNIMASGFMNALSTCLGMCLMPSVPAVRFGQVVTGGGEEPVLVAVTKFSFSEPELAAHSLSGVFLFALDTPARKALFQVVRRFVPVA